MNELSSSTRSSQPRSLLFRCITVVVVCIGLTVFTWLMDRASIKVQLDAYGGSYGSLVNAVPVLLLFLLLLSLFNRVLLSLAVTAGAVTALYVANYLKLKYLDVPVSFSDVYLLENLHAATFELLRNYVKLGYLLTATIAVIVIVGGSVCLERRFFRQRSFLRWTLALVVVFCMASLGAGEHWVGEMYSAKNVRVIAWAPKLTILHSGLISSIAYTSAERERALSVPVDQTAIDKLLSMSVPAATSNLPPADSNRPDIIVIQSESFFDPGILKDIDNTDASLPNLHRALSQGIGGTMKAPTFGGGTLRTEFEVLTGIPMAAYPQVEFPYLQITQRTIPSLVRVVKTAGYAAIAIHGNSGTFWNRTNAFEAIGFDRFITADDFPVHAARDGWYFADSAMTDQIIGQLQHTEKPTMIFAISIEAHGPYLHVPVDDKARRDAIPAPPGLSGNPLLEYRNYLYHIEDADQQMGRLWDFLAARKRPYILVFYGDHLPGLEHVYKATDFDNGKTGSEQFVPWFIVGSGVQQHTQHIKAWMMGSEILRAAGIAQTPYYRLIDKAERGLDESTTDARAEAIRQGIYSSSRLYLEGKFNVDLQHMGKNGESSDATIHQP